MVESAVRRRSTQRICSVLQKHDLVVPWPFERKTDAGVYIIDVLDAAVIHSVDSTYFGPGKIVLR